MAAAAQPPRPAPAGVEERRSGTLDASGRGLFATRAFQPGELICEDAAPLLAAPLAASPWRSGALCCARCLRPVGGPADQLAALAALPAASLSWLPPAGSDLQEGRRHRCRLGCGAAYCGAECEGTAWESYHRVLCPAAGAAAAALDSHCSGWGDHFALAARACARCVSGGAAVAQSEREQFAALSARGWSRYYAVPDSAAAEEGRYRRRVLFPAVRKAAVLLRAAVAEAAAGGRAPREAADGVPDAEGLDMLMGALLANNVAVTFPNPLCRYVAALPSACTARAAELDALLRQLLDAAHRHQQDAGEVEEEEEGEEGEESEESEGGSEPAEGAQPAAAAEAQAAAAAVGPAQQDCAACGGPDAAARSGSAADLAQRVAAHIPEEVECTGLFPTVAACNHSCRPNASYGALRPAPAVALVATAPIAAGTEITIPYIDTDLSLAERRAALRPYGFECRCPKCAAEAPGPAAKRPRR